MYEAKLAHVEPDTVPARPGEGRVIRRFLFNVATSPKWGIALASLIGANFVIRFLIGSEWLHYRDAPKSIHVQEVSKHMSCFTRNLFRFFFISSRMFIFFVPQLFPLTFLVLANETKKTETYSFHLFQWMTCCIVKEEHVGTLLFLALPKTNLSSQ